MSNPLKIQPLTWAQSPIVDKEGRISRGFLQWLSKVVAPAQQVISPAGDIHTEAPVRGRTEGLGTTVQNLTAAGKVNSTDNVIDGTGSPLTGGKRGFNALDSNNQIASSFNMKPVNVSATPTLATSLNNDGLSSLITITADTFQFASGTRSYNSASIDPGSYGTWFVYADDPTFAGGNVTYHFSATAADQTAAEGRVNFGKIKTTAGSFTSGGGYNGGTTSGGEGGRGFNQG